MAKTFLDIQNIRASKINESSANKILDTDLARFYNEVTSDMSKYGQILKKVTTNIAAGQSEYTNSVLPGFLSTSIVKIGGVTAPYIGIQDIPYVYDRKSICHTVTNNALTILPTPTDSATDALEVHYWAKLPEIVDGAVAETPLTDLDDKDWATVVAGIVAKCYEKLIIYISTNREGMPDADINSLTKIQEKFELKYQDELDKYGNQSSNYNHPTTQRGAASRENEMPTGNGRQNKL